MQEHGQLPAASGSLPRGRREPSSLALLTGDFREGSVLSRATLPPERACRALLSVVARCVSGRVKKRFHLSHILQSDFASRKRDILIFTCLLSALFSVLKAGTHGVGLWPPKTPTVVAIIILISIKMRK